MEQLGGHILPAAAAHQFDHYNSAQLKLFDRIQSSPVFVLIPKLTLEKFTVWDT
jgi:hypothetical protein